MESGRVYTTHKPTLKNTHTILNKIELCPMWSPSFATLSLQQIEITCPITCNDKAKYKSKHKFPNNSNYFEPYNSDSDSIITQRFHDSSEIP